MSETEQVIHKSALTGLDLEHKVKILLAAYEKHAKELLALEEAQQKLVLLLLGVFSVGISLLPKLQDPPRAALAVLAIALAAFGWVYTHQRNRARASIRWALVRIETALRFYEAGRYLEGESLYPEEFARFHAKKWIGWLYVPVLVAAATFVVLLLAR